MIRITVFLAVLLSCVSGVGAQSIAELDKREAAVLDAWQKTPLTIRRAAFVSASPAGFGQYDERLNVFRPGEKLIAYAEPVGFGWKDLGGGTYAFGFHTDFTIYDASGKEIGSQNDFADLELKSHARNREFMVTLTLNIAGAPPGDYVIEYRLRDVTGDKSTSFKLPFKIAG